MTVCRLLLYAKNRSEFTNCYIKDYNSVFLRMLTFLVFIVFTVWL
jgi:hypothetical protein